MSTVTHTSVTNYDTSNAADWASYSLIPAGSQASGDTVTTAKYGIQFYPSYTLTSLFYYNANDKKWYDDNSGIEPFRFVGSNTGGSGNWLTKTQLNSIGWSTTETIQNPRYVYLNQNTDFTNIAHYHMAFENPYYDANWSSGGGGSGPTVTSITADKVVVPSDTISNTDFTLLKNGSAYANSNISVTLGTFDPADTPRFYDYNLQYDGSAFYRRTIDSKSYEAFEYDNSWIASPSSGRSTNSTRILNVLATIPSTTSITSGSGPLTSVFSNNSRVMTYTYTQDLSSINLSANTTIDIIFLVEQRLVNNVSEICGFFYEIHTANSIRNSWTASPLYIIGDQETMSYTQNLLGVATTFSVSDWVYRDQPEGDDYEPPVTTTSNGGGKPDRYPLIMTNLFNRNRSLYSIGMTHKDTWDLFL